jgi:glycosyltransferase involved in cell wall biosynthesis
MPNRARIGIWAGWDESVDWMAEDALRVLSFLVEGAAARDTVTFCIHVSVVNFGPAGQVLRGLVAREGVDWILTTDSWTPSFVASRMRWLRSYGVGRSPRIPPVSPMGTAEGTAQSGSEPQTAVVQESPNRPDPPSLGAWLLRRPPEQMRWVLVALVLFIVPLQLLRMLLRPIWRFLWRNGLSAMTSLLCVAALGWRDPTAAAAAIAPRLEQRPLRPLRWFGRTLRIWASEARYGATTIKVRPVTVAALPETDGWLLLRPDFVSGLALPGRRIALFPNAIPLEFPFQWDGARRWEIWKRRTAETLAGVDGVVTLSRHVAERHVAGFFGLPHTKVTPMPTAMPDLWSLLPVRTPDRVPTPNSRHAAANILRDHAAERRRTYLTDFPFEDVPYVVVSAQDHPTKNIALAVEAVRLLLRRDYFDIKLFTIARLDKPHEILWQAVHDGGMQMEALSVPDLSRAARAALYHCAALTVHPSFVEGGVGCLEFAESVSVGTPCLMALGPHSLELLEEEPVLQPFLFDPFDAEALAVLIRRTIADRSDALSVQEGIRKRQAHRSWGDVAEKYAAVVSGTPVGGAIPPAGQP